MPADNPPSRIPLLLYQALSTVFVRKREHILTKREYESNGKCEGTL